MNNIKILEARFLEIQKAFENGEDDHELIYDLEDELQKLYNQALRDKEISEVDKLDKKVKSFKRQYDFYDAEAELDHMFPDRHEEDFDEDSMSWNSIFGDD